MSQVETAIHRWRPEAQAVLRIMVALLFLSHGTSKLLGFPESPQGVPEPMSLGWIAGIFELFGGVLFLVGLFTRPVAFVLSGLMAAAYFIAHAPQAFHPLVNQGELAVVYCFVFLYFFFAGPGARSIDANWRRHRLYREIDETRTYSEGYRRPI